MQARRSALLAFTDKKEYYFARCPIGATRFDDEIGTLMILAKKRALRSGAHTL